MLGIALLLAGLGVYPVYIFTIVLPLIRQQKRSGNLTSNIQCTSRGDSFQQRLLLWLKEEANMYSLAPLAALLLLCPVILYFSSDNDSSTTTTLLTLLGYLAAYQLSVYTLRTLELLSVSSDVITHNQTKKDDADAKCKEKEKEGEALSEGGDEEGASFVFESLPLFVAHFLLPVRLSLMKPLKEEDPLFKKHKKKELVLKEIVETERAYVKNLKDFQKAYHQGLLDLPKEKREAMLSDVEMKCIFGNLTSIILINETLLDSLQKRVTGWLPDRSVGDIFVEMAPYFKEYTEYSNNYKKALDCYLARLERSPEFKEFILQVATHPDYSYFDFNDYIIMPIQRVPRYLLLLKELIKATDEGETEREKLEKALKVTTAITEHINERMHKMESMNKVLEIQNRFEPDEKMPPLVTATCRHVHDQEVRLLMPKEKVKRRHLFLFNELMIVASFVRLSSTEGNYKYTFKIPINVLAIQSAATTQHKRIENAFVIKCNGDKEYIFGAMDPEGQEQWVKLINEQVVALHNIIQRPRRESLRQPELEKRLPGTELVTKISKKVKWQEVLEVFEISPMLSPSLAGYRRITRAGAKIAFYFLAWLAVQTFVFAIERTLPSLLSLRAAIAILPQVALHALALTAWTDLSMGVIAHTLLRGRDVYMTEPFHLPQPWRDSIRQFWLGDWFIGPTRIGMKLAKAKVLPLIAAVGVGSIPPSYQWTIEYLDLPFGVLCQGLLFFYVSIATRTGWMLPFSLILFFTLQALLCWVHALLHAQRQHSATTDSSVPESDSASTGKAPSLQERAEGIILSSGVSLFLGIYIVAIFT